MASRTHLGTPQTFRQGGRGAGRQLDAHPHPIPPRTATLLQLPESRITKVPTQRAQTLSCPGASRPPEEETAAPFSQVKTLGPDKSNDLTKVTMTGGKNTAETRPGLAASEAQLPPPDPSSPAYPRGPPRTACATLQRPRWGCAGVEPARSYKLLTAEMQAQLNSRAEREQATGCSSYERPDEGRKGELYSPQNQPQTQRPS